MTRKLLLAATLLGSVSIAATATARPMTPEDVAKLEPVCLKWPSGELDNTALLRQAAGRGKSLS